jgi:hypothetical protein
MLDRFGAETNLEHLAPRNHAMLPLRDLPKPVVLSWKGFRGYGP